MDNIGYSMALITFLFLAGAMLSFWFERKPIIWGTFLALSLLAGLFAGLLSMLGIAWVLLLGFFWHSYSQKSCFTWFLAIVILSLALKMHLLSGFYPIALTSKFTLGLEGPLIGLFPLALIVPLAKSLREWRVALQGTMAGVAGIAIMAALAILTNTVSFDCKLPSMMAPRTFSNLFFTSIPEEGFYRGFLQNSVCRYFGNSRGGNMAALFLTSVIFTAAHIFWSPDLAVLGFVFLAGLLYGAVYLWSGRIEAAIATHFLLNLIHQSCFSYHAM